MKKTIHVCDLCKQPRIDFKLKYHAKRRWLIIPPSGVSRSGWKKIELCKTCLDKIINNSTIAE